MDAITVISVFDLLERFHNATSLQSRLMLLADGIHDMGWGRVHVYLFDTNTRKIKSAAYCGMTTEDIAHLEANRMTFENAQLVISKKYDKFKVGSGYYFPYGESDEKIEFIRDSGTSSKKDPQQYKGWHPRDMLFFPLVGVTGEVIGLASVDDPVELSRPTSESLLPVELFIDYTVKRLEKDEIKTFLTRTGDFLSRMFFVSPLAIIFKNSREEITDANPFAMNLFGYDRPEIIGLSADTLYGTHDVYKRVSKRRMLDNQFIGEVQFKKKNGAEFWGYLVSVKVNDGEGSIEGFLSMILDMTESKNLQQYLIRAEKMAGIGVLASGIAHELNNPLYGILGLAETILEESDMELIKEYTSDIVRYSKEAAGIIRDLSGYSYSARTDTSSTVDVNSVIHRALQMMKRIDMLSGITVITELSELPEINASAGELQQIFINMITNANDAMRESDKKILSITTKMMGDFIQICFTDTGVGISEDARTQIFEPFYTTKELGKGTGLGLYICYRIATKYQGRIDVESTQGAGSCFIITLPVKRK